MSLANCPAPPDTVNTAWPPDSATAKLLTESGRSSFGRLPALAAATMPLVIVGITTAVAVVCALV